MYNLSVSYSLNFASNDSHGIELNYSQMLHFKSIAEFNKHFGLPEPEDPLFYAIRPPAVVIKTAHLSVDQIPIKNDFYVIVLKKIIKGSFHYGRTNYDCTTGILVFVGSGQITEMRDAEFEYGGFSLSFHKDFFLGYPLFDSLSKYNFFKYAINEALHLSPEEEKILQELYNNIEAEYNKSKDELSKELIISNIEIILKYSQRYYRRQFHDREHLSKGIFNQFLSLLNVYVNENEIAVSGPPTLDWLAKELSVSKRYLSDSLKIETGKTAKHQINLFLIEQAKSLLLMPKASISETAYKLGFKYPQYFTRLFKKKTGMNPSQFIQSKSID